MNKELIKEKELKRKIFIKEKESRRTKFTQKQLDSIKIKNEETFQEMQYLTGYNYDNER